MIDEPLEELAALHALDLLEGAERLEFESTLARDSVLQSLVDDLRATAASIALVAPYAEPPAALKSRLLATIAARRAEAEGKVIQVSAFTFRLLLAAAACLAFSTLWVGRLYVSSRAESSALQQQQHLADLALQSARNQVEAERILATRESETARTQLAELSAKLKAEGDLAQLKIAALASLAGNSPQALAVAVWSPAKQEGVFTVDHLPATAAGQDYELWVIADGQPKPISAGVFAVGADGKARVKFHPEAPVAAVAKFAVSTERKGGAPAHSGPAGKVIMLGP